MAPTDHHVPDVDLHKHSLLPAGKHANRRAIQNGAPVPANGTYRMEDDWERPIQITQTSTKTRRRNEGAIAVICRWIVEHQIGLSINVLLLHALTTIFIPRARHTTRKFYQLSYYNPTSGKYAAGWDDLYFSLYAIIALTGLRAATMDYVLVPLASLAGVKKPKENVRFAEQAWILVYESVFWSLGMYIMYHGEHWLNNKALWTGWPSREIDGAMKWYYLVEFSFYLQQIFIVNIEERRKDHWQMFGHHCITCALMFWSYGYHQTRVGNLILVLMDFVDLFLAFAKILKYMKYQLACDIAFGVFMLVWFVARHVLYMMTTYSLYKDSTEQTQYGCYSGGAEDLKGPLGFPPGRGWLVTPFTDPKGLVCWDDRIKWGFIYMLCALQVILIVWFGMIMRVAVKVLKGTGADDTRSDNEDEEDEDETIEVSLNQPPIHEPRHYHEEEVGVEDIKLHKQRSSPVRRYRKGGGISSGVTLPSDRKELLGRIGCDGGHD